MRWIRFTAAFTAALVFWSTILGTGVSFAEAPEESEGQVIRTIVGRDTNGWAVVDIRTVTGEVVILSPEVGREVGLEEAIKLSVFQGPSEFNRRAPIPILGTSVPGFREAIFIKRQSGRYGVRIEFRSADKIRFRTIRLEETDVSRIREYVEHFEEIQRGEYRIHKRDTQIEEGSEYPKLTDETITFETRVPRFVLTSRMDGSLTLKDGQELKGEFVPLYDEGSILIESDFRSHTVPVENIQRIRTSGNKSSSAMRGAVRTALGSAVSGALTGALAAWQSNGDVKEWMIFGTLFFGAAGFITGLTTGIGRGRSSEDIELGPIGDTMDEKS